MKAKKYSLLLFIVYIAAAIWVWNNKQSIFGYISAVLFLVSAVLCLIAYKKNSPR